VHRLLERSGAEVNPSLAALRVRLLSLETRLGDPAPRRRPARKTRPNQKEKTK
jgi:hypothetical protein